MIVLDASVVVELLTNGILANAIRNELAKRNESFIVPHLIDVEVVSAIRRLTAGERIDAHRSGQFLDGLAALPRRAVSAHTINWPCLGTASQFQRLRCHVHRFG